MEIVPREKPIEESDLNVSMEEERKANIFSFKMSKEMLVLTLSVGQESESRFLATYFFVNSNPNPLPRY